MLLTNLAGEQKRAVRTRQDLRDVARTSVICGLLLLCGCATAPKPREITAAFEYHAEFELVWGACVYSLIQMELPISALDKDAGAIGSEWIDLRGTKNDEYCDCGFPGIMRETGRQGRVDLVVREADGAYTVDVICQYKQASAFGGVVVISDCVSTGRMEETLDATIRRAIAKHLGHDPPGGGHGM